MHGITIGLFMAPERFTYAIEEIKPIKDDHILEIGCGNGLLIELLSRIVTTGKIIGLDQSAVAIAQASKRNQASVKDGRIILLNQSLKNVKFPNNTFDKIVSFNVNVFLKNSIKEFNIIRDALKSEGKLFTFYQFPYTVDISATEVMINGLKNNGFNILDSKVYMTHSTPVILVVASKR